MRVVQRNPHYEETSVTVDVAIQEGAAESAESAQRVERAVVPGLGNTTATFVRVGPSSTNQLLFRITNLHFTTGQPAVVMLQPRQGDNQNFNFPDQFAVQVITTAPDNVLCLIRRLDANLGWGQNLRLDLFAVDRVVNP